MQSNLYNALVARLAEAAKGGHTYGYLCHLLRARYGSAGLAAALVVARK